MKSNNDINMNQYLINGKTKNLLNQFNSSTLYSNFKYSIFLNKNVIILKEIIIYK